MREHAVKVSRNLPYSMIDNTVLTDETLSPIDKIVFCVLCVHAGIESRKCILKVSTIAREANCSARSVQNSLKTLEERGIIKRTERFKEGSQVSSSYQVIGREAPCYTNTGCNTCTPPCTTCTSGVQETTPHINEKSLNDINNSLTGEAELPSPEEFPEMPDEYSPEDAPDIMKPTAEYLLLKTGRESLTWEEISALRELAVNQYPSRVQKEINRAYERFRRKGHDMKKLTFAYIAGSLKHQPTRNRQKLKVQSDPMSMTSAEVDEANVKNGMTDSEMQYWLEKCERECV